MKILNAEQVFTPITIEIESGEELAMLFVAIGSLSIDAYEKAVIAEGTSYTPKLREVALTNTSLVLDELYEKFKHLARLNGLSAL